MLGEAARRGWGASVLTLDQSQIETKIDKERLTELPSGTRVYGVRVPKLRIERLENLLWSFYKRLRRRPTPAKTDQPSTGQPQGQAPDNDQISLAASELKWNLRHLSRADRHYYAWLHFATTLAWAEVAQDLARRILDEEPHQIVISCGPPHQVHSAGLEISQERALPLVVDMRDPYSLVERLPVSMASPLFLYLARRMERPVIAGASLIVANTEPARSALNEVYPDASSRTLTVTNGYDDEPVPSAQYGRRFVAAYAGSVYLDRDPTLLMRAAATIVRDLRLTPEDFGLEFIGYVDTGYDLAAIAKREGLEREFVSVRPPCSRRELFQQLAKAAMLISLPQDSHLAIPSKIFEYMKFRAWLLVLAETGSASELLLRNTAADVVLPQDVNGMTAAFRRRYEQFAGGVFPSPLATNEQFSRTFQADRLFLEIEKIVGSSHCENRREHSLVAK